MVADENIRFVWSDDETVTFLKIIHEFFSTFIIQPKSDHHNIKLAAKFKHYSSQTEGKNKKHFHHVF